MTKPEAFTAGKTETALAWTQRCTHICFRVSQYLAIYPEMAACEQFDTSFHSVMQNVNLAIKEWAYHRLDLAHDILVTQVPKDHLYGQMAQSVLFTIDALLGTMSDQKFQVAANSLWSTIQASNSKRVTTPWLGQVKPTDYTEEQLHAELIFAECSVFYSVVIVLKDKSVTAVVKAALHGRASHSAFKECNRILQSDRKWSSQESQDAFSSGTTLGLGLYELVMSFLPTRLAKVLQYIGYSGDHQVGLNCLKQCVALSDTCRWPFAVMIFVFYNNFFANIFGTGIKEQPLCEDIVQMFCKKFEASPYATWLTACIHCSRGDVQSASDEFDKIVKLPSDLATKDLPLAETIMLMRAQVAIFQLNWSDAIGWIELFRARSSLSPALACFVQASLLIEQSVDEDDDSLRNQAIELFRAVRTLKKTFGGRMAFHEQFVVERSKQFVKDISSCHLPLFELLYILNYFNYAKSPGTVNKLSQFIETRSTQLDSKSSVHIFFSGFFKSLLSNSEGELDFRRILESNPDTNEKHLIAQSYFELALMAMKRKDTDYAVSLFNQAKNGGNHLTSTMVNHRTKLYLAEIKAGCAN